MWTCDLGAFVVLPLSSGQCSAHPRERLPRAARTCRISPLEAPRFPRRGLQTRRKFGVPAKKGNPSFSRVLRMLSERRANGGTRRSSLRRGNNWE
jgi:hypothetical protein